MNTRVFLVSILFLGAPGCASDGPVEISQVGETCSTSDECDPNSVCFREICVGDGDLRVSLAFPTDSDFDLHVLTPLGNEIFFGNREADGGFLDVDQCISSCGTDSTHVENVVFSETAPRGEYRVWVRNFDGRAAGSFEIEVSGDVQMVFEGSLAAESFVDSDQFVFVLP